MIRIYFILIFSNSLSITLSSLENPLVKTESGSIIGKFDGNFYSFHSIPFAQPPIGINRFEPPKPIEGNPDIIINGTNFAAACLQWTHFNKTIDRLMGDEDCLYLNIYTPSIDRNSFLPVIVFIHGGAFQYGTGNVFGPKLLMKHKKFIMVTISYRVGPLGFLTTNDDEIHGNLGLKDQQLALKWINKNIENFGGNSSSITLVGFSAGGASVHFHMLNDVSNKLFSNAISFSGTTLSPWVMVRDPLSRTKKFAEILNCPTSSTKLIKECLKNLSGDDIVRAVGKFQFMGYFPFRYFGPVVEPSFVPDTFLKEEPETLMKLKEQKPIPWIVSFTSDDGSYNAAELMKIVDGSELLNKFWENFDENLPKAVFYEEHMNAEETKNYTLEIRQKYKINDEDNINDKFFKIQKVFTDELFAKPAIKSIILHKKFSETPVFGYVYDHPSPMCVGNLISKRFDINFGSGHGDDVFLMFEVPHRKNLPFTDEEAILSSKFHDMLLEFNKFGVAKFGEIDLLVKMNSEDIDLLKITGEDSHFVKYSSD